MTATAHHSPVDEFTPETLKQLATLENPCVTLLMPTRPDARDPRHHILQLRALVADAAMALRGQGADPDEILAPVSALQDDTRFWAEQGEGLAIFADRSTHHVYRLPSPVQPLSQVGPAPRLIPLVPAAVGDVAFHVLAVSQNKVRLFTATRDSIRELDLGPIPASLEDMERSAGKEPELQHQHQPARKGTAIFHGHGGTSAADTVVDKFLVEVAAGARARLGAAGHRPLVLAAVTEYLPRLRDTGQLPALLDKPVAGNHDHTHPVDLLELAWPSVRAVVEARHSEMAERFGAAHGTGTAMSDPAELQRAATRGRVGTLLVPESCDGRTPTADDDLTLVAALRTGADLAVTDLPPGVRLAALLRY